MVWGKVGMTVAPMVLGSMFNRSSGADARRNTGPSLWNRATDGAMGFGLGEAAEMLIQGQQEGFGTALGLAGAAGAFNQAGSDENSYARMAGAVAGVFLAQMALTSMGMDPNSLTSKAIMGVAAYAGASVVGSMTDSTPAATTPAAAPQQPALAAPAT